MSVGLADLASVIARVRESAQSPESRFWVALDQVISSAANVGLVLVAARFMTPNEAGYVAIAIAVTTVSIGLQRSAVLVPSLAAQRHVGKSAVPLRWARYSVPPASAVAGALAAVAFQISGGLQIAALAGIACIPLVLLQDFMRYRLLMMGSARRATVVDGAWLVFTASAFALLTMADMTTPGSAFLTWTLGAAISLFGLIGSGRSQAALPDASLRETWRLGRWSLADSALAGVVQLLPLFVAGIVLSPAVAGSYRVLQTSLVPLNYLNTVLATTMGLAAHELSNPSGLAALSRKVRHALPLMALAAVIVTTLGQATLAWFANLSLADNLVPAAAIALTGLIGAVTTPLSSAAIALGQQVFGAAIRLLSVIASVFTVYWGTTAATGARTLDPVGLTMVVAGSISLAGWAIGYQYGRRQTHKDFQRVGYAPVME
ncbi:hypothetical protein [Demequina rhizosphaerae]|uniref:hypothetical protein n=1 Tax=Demequina rhizosphaerae TaxID=1638985 RepID=UPI000A86CD20|nr:hypothetical protein [Demequina rhizosphaerae]